MVGFFSRGLESEPRSLWATIQGCHKASNEDSEGERELIMCRKCFRFTLHLFISLLFPHCSPAERAWFRLSAGNAILKICEQKGVGDKYTLEQFYTFSRLFVDPVPQVRERILIKLHKVKDMMASWKHSLSNPARLSMTEFPAS